MSDSLTTTEAARLSAAEQRIERGLTTFVEVGEALMEIRNERLYRERYTRFDDYCRERWGFGRERAHRLIQAAEVTAVLPIGNTPANEAVARELPREPEQAREVWQATLERHGDKPTAAQVREVRTEVVEGPAGVSRETPASAPVVFQMTPAAPVAATPEPSVQERVARTPHILAGKAIERLQEAVQTIEVAGGVDSIMESLDESPLAPTLRDSWAYFIVEAHEVIGQWRSRVESRPDLRVVR